MNSSNRSTKLLAHLRLRLGDLEDLVVCGADQHGGDEVVGLHGDRLHGQGLGHQTDGHTGRLQARSDELTDL